MRFSLAAAVLAILALTSAGFAVSFILGVLLLLAVLALVAILFSTYVVGPLDGLRRAMRSLSEGSYEARAEAGHTGGIGALGQQFNLLAQALQREMAAASRERGRLAAALNSGLDAFIALGADGSVSFANRAAQDRFSTGDRKALNGQQLTWFLADEAVVEAFRASRDRGLATQGVVERPGRRFFQVVTTPIEGGGDWSVLLVLHDITDVTRTEQMRRDFVANVSHELRTPLAGMKSVIEALLGGALDERPVATDFLHRADAEVDRLVQLLDELLELSRIESGEFPLSRSDTDVELLVSDVLARLEPQARRKRQKIDRNLQGNPGALSLDAAKIDRALANLLHNAIKFSPEETRISVQGTWSESNLLISVRDSGPGIDASDLPRIFERFYKADRSRVTHGGSGLGLALARHAVEAHGGTLTVDSKIGEGSTFVLQIPIEEQAVLGSPAQTG